MELRTGCEAEVLPISIRMMKTNATRKSREEMRAKTERVRVLNLSLDSGAERSLCTEKALSEDDEDVRSRRLRGGRNV